MRINLFHRCHRDTQLQFPVAWDHVSDVQVLEMQMVANEGAQSPLDAFSTNSSLRAAVLDLPCAKIPGKQDNPGSGTLPGPRCAAKAPQPRVAGDYPEGKQPKPDNPSASFQ